MVGPNKINTFIALTAGVDFCEGTVAGHTIALEAVASPMSTGIERIMSLARRYSVNGEP
jgi:hypothetical protein